MLPFFREKHISPERVYIACPDCDTVCAVMFTVLTNDGKCKSVATCEACNDGVSVGLMHNLNKREYAHFYKAGVPVIHYGAA
jgi:hypothetical protein